MSGVVNSGKFDPTNKNNFVATPKYSYCQEAVAAATYPSPTATDQNHHDFGFRANGIVITNEGAADLCYAFPAVYGQLTGGNQVDSGIVKANSTLILPNLVGHEGLLVRGRSSGGSNYVVSAY